MSDDLHVATARLHQLADAQRLAGDQFTAATALPASTPPAVAVTHGAAAAATAAALTAVQAARADAGLRMAAVSHGMGSRLSASAARYDGADRAAGDILAQQILGTR